MSRFADAFRTKARPIQVAPASGARPSAPVAIPTTSPLFVPKRHSPAGTFDPYDKKPVHLTGVVTLDPNASAAVNALALQNPMMLPMEICEIKVALLVIGAGVSGPVLNGGSVGLQLMLGQYAITNGFVPVWLFGPARNLGSTTFASTAHTQSEGGESFSDSSADASFSFTWRLSRPLYVPVGSTLIPAFQHRGTVSSQIVCRVGYSARILPPDYVPDKLILPYVAAWSTCKTFDELGSADSDQSSEMDLVNVNEEEVHVDRFVGRINESGAAGTTNYGEDAVADFGYRLLQARMTDSMGNWIARDWTGFRTLFPAISRTWELQPGVVLPPKHFYVAYANKVAPPIVTANFRSGQPQISLVGWREVQP